MLVTNWKLLQKFCTYYDAGKESIEPLQRIFHQIILYCMEYNNMYFCPLKIQVSYSKKIIKVLTKHKAAQEEGGETLCRLLSLKDPNQVKDWKSE